MLQEESAKRLSSLVHKTFSKAQFGEFTSRLDIKLDAIEKDQKQIDGGPQSRLNKEIQMKERGVYQSRLSSIQAAPKQESSNPLGANFPQFSDHRPQNVPNNQGLDGRSGSGITGGQLKSSLKMNSMQNMMGYQNKTPVSGALKQLSIGESLQTSEDLSSQMKSGIDSQLIQRLKSNSNIKNQLKRKDSIMVRQKTTFQPKRKSSQANVNLMRRQTIKQLDSGMGGGSPPPQRKGPIEGIEEREVMQAEFDSKVQYLCYGDIIMLSYTQKIFQADINDQKEDETLQAAWDGESVDEAKQNLMDDQDRKERVKLQKLIQEPNYTYKGMVYCDGILDKNLRIIPRESQADTTNAKCQFKKCLFSVEIFDNCTYHMLHRKQVNKVAELKEHRESILDLDDFQKVAQVNQQIAAEEEVLKRLKDEMKLEGASNKEVQDDHFGQNVQYGDRILLRHIFTDSFFRIEPAMIAEHEGRVQVVLGELSVNSIMNFIPAQDIGGIAAELVIHGSGISKFNLHVGGQINLQDSFFLLNREIGANYYVTVNPKTAAGPGGQHKVLEFDAGLHPTYLRANLFLAASENIKEKLASTNKGGEEGNNSKLAELIYSGDTVRLKNQETHCYLQIQTRQTGKRSAVNPFPQFLQRQIQRLADLPEDYEVVKEEKGLFDIDQDDFDLVDNQEQASQLLIGMDTDPRWQSTMNSCWELQQVKSLKGGYAVMNGLYRFKHIATERYLSLDQEGRVNLVLKSRDIQQLADTLFILRPINQEQELEDDDEEIEGHEIYHGTKFYLETAYNTFLQVYQRILDESELHYSYVNQTKNDYYTKLKSDSMTSVVAGAKQLTCEEGEPKMVFIIELVPKEESLMAFKSLGYNTAIKNFYNFLNDWGVGPAPKGLTTIDNLCYSPQVCVETEGELASRVGSLTASLADVREILEEAQGESKRKFKMVQKELQEHFLTELLAYTIELIYYKTMPEEFREKAFKPDRLRAGLGGGQLTQESHMGFQVARDKLDALNHEILEILYLMIRDNELNSERLTQFVDVLKLQLIREDKQFVTKIICHMYKMARYIFNDRASVLLAEKGLNQNLPPNFTTTRQLEKWINLIETVHYRSPEQQNLDLQTLYIRVISAILRQKKFDESVRHQQVQLLTKVIHDQPRTPLWFGYNRQANKLKRPFLYFARLNGESMEKFLQINPYLNQCCTQQQSLDSDKKFDIIFDMSELTKVARLDRENLVPYLLYVKAVVDMYEQLCKDRSMQAMQAMRNNLGLSNNLLLVVCEAEHKQVLPMDQILKDAFLRFVKTAFYNYLPFNKWPVSEQDDTRMMCFIWDKLADANPHQTVFGWEKFKYSEQGGSGFAITQKEVEETSRKLRQILIDYFMVSTMEYSEKLYASEGKTYKAEQLNPVLQQLIDRFKTVQAALKAEATDAFFCQRIVEASMQILAAFSCPQLIFSLQELWVYKTIRAASPIPRCAYKLRKLVQLVLDTLRLICETRRSEQVLFFLKIFRDLQEEFDFSFVGFNATLLEPKFKRLFQMLQFSPSLEVSSLSKMLLMMDPELPIFDDSQREQRFFEQQREAIKDLAVRTQQAKKPIKVKKSKQQDPNQSISFEDLPTGQALLSPVSTVKPNTGHFEIEMAKRTASEAKTQLLAPNNETVADDDDEDSPRDDAATGFARFEQPQLAQRLDALWRSKQPIEEFLLYYAFISEANDDIPLSAMSSLSDCMNQRKKLLNLVQQVQLIVSKEYARLYHELVYLKERIESLVSRIVADEYTQLIYQMGQQDKTEIHLRDLQSILRRVIILLKKSHGFRLFRLQAFIRQMQMDRLLIDGFMRHIYFSHELHETTFKLVLELLFYKCLHNATNQNHMRPHVPYLVHLIVDMNLPAGALLGQLVSAQRLDSEGQKFTNFIVRRVVEQNLQKSQLYKLLNFLVLNTQTLKILVMSQLTTSPVFRHKLYMRKKNVSVKVERIKEITRKVLVLQSRQHNVLTRSQLDPSIRNDYEALQLHLSVVDLMASCAVENTYGVKQIRRIVDLDCLLDSILAQAVPFVFKKSYLRLLFNGYLQEIEDVNMLDLSWPKFLLVLRHIVLYDVQHYYLHYPGLAVPYVEEHERDDQQELDSYELRMKVVADLQRVSDNLFESLNAHKNYKQKLEEKEFMIGLSPLNQNRVIQFLDSKNKAEYWTYFCSYDTQLRRNDGLVYFVRDFYRAVARKLEEWPQELIEITLEMKDTLLVIIDKLDQLKENYLENIVDLDNVQFALDEAVNAIPDLTRFRKKPKKLNLMGEEVTDDEADLVGKEQFGPEVQERILRICRDNIITNNSSIRRIFKIESKASDVLVNPYYIKKKMKDVCGIDVTYREISWFIKTSMEQMQKKLLLKGVLGQEMGMPGYVRARYQTMMLQSGLGQQNILASLFNFRELETMIKSVLGKAGYKQALIEREEAVEDEKLAQMDEEYLEIGVQSDLQHFVKLFQEFLLKYSDSDQVNDLATKILQRFNKVFIDAFRQLGACGDKETAQDLPKMFEYRLLKTQLSRIVIYIEPLRYPSPQQVEHKVCMLRLMCSMLELMDPDKLEIQVRTIASQRRVIVQNLMASVGVLRCALLNINPNESIEVVDQSIHLIDLLSLGDNLFILEQLMQSLQSPTYGFSYFKMVEQKIVTATKEIIQQGGYGSQDSPPVDQEGNYFDEEKENRKREQTVKDVLINNFEEPLIQRNNELQQPIFYPLVYSIEEQGLQLKPSRADALLQLLSMCQRQIDSECGFELILAQQAANVRKNVNLVKAIAYAFIDIIRTLKHQIFDQFILIEVLQQLLITLIKVLESHEAKEIKIQFAQWDLLLGQINWVLELDFHYFLVDKVEARFKVRLLAVVLRFLVRLVTHSDFLVQVQITSLLVKFLNKQNLRNKLLDLFKAKIGGTPHREKVYRTRAFCKHIKQKVQRKPSLCHKNEHCFYEHLLPMDLITIQCTEDLFMVLYILNITLPKHKLDEIKFDHRVTGYFFHANLKQMLPQLHYEAFNQISDQASRLAKTVAERHKIKTLTGEEQKGMEPHEVNQIMEQLYIQYATQKYIDSVKRDEKEQMRVRTEKHSIGLDQFIDQGIDQEERLVVSKRIISADENPFSMQEDTRNAFYIEELENLEWDEVFLELLKEQSSKGLVSRLRKNCCRKPAQDAGRLKRCLAVPFCCSWLSRFKKTSGLTPKEKTKVLVAMRQHLTSKEELDRVYQFFKKREQQVQKSRDFVGPFFGSYTRQILQNQVYVYDTFKYEYAFQFMLEQVSKVQIQFDDGSLHNETFIIPNYAHFLTQATRDGIKTKTKWELLENLAVMRVEMQSLQAMERFSPFVLSLVSKYTWSLQMSYWLTFVQNGVLLMTYTREKLLQPFTKDMIKGRVDLKQNEGDSWIDYSLEIMSMCNMQALFFSLWSYQILYFSVLEFNMNSDKPTNWLTGMCKRKPKEKQEKTSGSLHSMYLDPKLSKVNPSQDFNDKKIAYHLVLDDEFQDSSKTLLRRISQIPSMQTPPGSPVKLKNLVLRILSKIAVLGRAPFHDKFQLQLLIFMAVSFFAIWLDWWNLTIMLLHLFMRVPFLNALLQVFKKSFRNLLRLLFLGFIMLYALSYVRLLDAFSFKTENLDGTQTRLLHSAARPYGNESFFPEKRTTVDTLLEAMQQVIGVEFHRNTDNTFTILDKQISGSLIQEGAQTTVIAIFFLFVGMFIGTILGGNISKGEVKLEEIKCQVCDVSRANYEAKKLTQQDWDNHINKEHNIYAYVYYMLLCCEGGADEKRRMTRTQKYVRKKLLSRDLSFMPIYNGDE